jgi:serine/threonine-protein kinase
MADPRHSRLVDYRRGLARYVPVARIAVGGMGEIWRGKACFPDNYVEEVAIKRMLPWLSENELYRLMLEDEARLGMLLKHDNIVRVYDARLQGTFILVMEYVEGRSLAQVLGRMGKREMQMPLAASLCVARSLVSALTYAHEALDEFGRELGVIHGDVSPHNVLVSVRGHVKLMDFGLARTSANLANRDPKKVSGKPGYVAPELVSRHEASQLNDLFSLGIVFWECLTGRRLFKGKNPVEDIRLVRRCDVPEPSRYNAAVTPELDALVTRMLAKYPEDRHQSARAVARDLEPIMNRLECGRGKGQLGHLTRRAMREAQEERAARDSLVPMARDRQDLDDVITGLYPRMRDASSSQELV